MFNSCRTDHGFNQDSQAIQFLYEISQRIHVRNKRLFLQFVTGSPRLPTGRFKITNTTTNYILRH
ncbi:E3 ubiquitin-protein ligase TRIP12 [Lucilia cuprina]|nr:E3 ubiquitin-protein ligase TRIP12 [Lucilia cuprina]